MVLMMACELTFSTPAESGTFPNCQTTGCGAGVATGRWARRHAAPAVVGRFIFFATRLGSLQRLGFCRTGRTDGRRTDGRRTDDGRNRANPRPPFQEQKIAKNFIAIFFAILIITVVLQLALLLYIVLYLAICYGNLPAQTPRAWRLQRQLHPQPWSSVFIFGR